MMALVMDAMGSQRRRFHRFPVEGAVRLYSGSAMWSTQLIDMSLRGALVYRPDDWDGSIGNRYRLDVRLEGGPIIGMAVSLARITVEDLGFDCQKIDLDSFSRLKRLIELNIGNTEILNRELSSLGR